MNEVDLWLFDGSVLLIKCCVRVLGSG